MQRKSKLDVEFKIEFLLEKQAVGDRNKIEFNYQLKIIIIYYFKKNQDYMEEKYVAPEELRSRFKSKNDLYEALVYDHKSDSI